MERDTALEYRERGSSLFLVLFATSLIGYLSYRLILHTSAYNELVRAYRLGYSEQLSARDQLSAPYSAHRLCSTQTTTTAKGGMKRWSVCALGTPALVKNQAIALPAGRIDFNALFRTSPACQWERRSSTSTVFTTPQARMTCFAPATIEGDLRSLDNIAAGQLVLRPPPLSNTASLTTPGAIDIENSLTLHASTLIVAGGSIRIPHLIASAPDRISVTIVSAHGDIIVGQITGAVSILGLGRQLLSIPSTPTSTSFLMPPFSTQPSIAGLIPVGDD